MRPRKVVLCLTSSESRLSERSFLLSTRGYEVLRALSVSVAQEHLSSSKDIRLLLVDLPVSEWSEGDIVNTARRLRPNLRSVVVGNSVGYQETIADAYLPQGSDSPTEILLRIKLLMQCKRGPKKQAKTNAVDATALPVPSAPAEYAAR